MRVEQLLLGAILGALVFVPAGYIVRVWLSSAAESVSRLPCVDEIYDSLDRHMKAINELGTRSGSLESGLQLMESKLTLMSNEQVDFFDKTRKSEERTRGLARRAEAAIGDDEDTAASDQQMLELMEQQAVQPEPAEEGSLLSRDAYYRGQQYLDDHSRVGG